jgi:hypothetical protein
MRYVLTAMGNKITCTLKMEVASLSETLVLRPIKLGSNASARFDSRPDNRLSRLRMFVVFLSSWSEMPERCLKSGHDRFLPHTFQFTVILLYHAT